MSTYVPIDSACGRTIIESREAWEDYSYEDYMEEMWGMDSTMSDPSDMVTP